MKLSIIVIFHNMRREARRTLLSLSPDYQRNLVSSDYEIIAIDNGSEQALDGDWVRSFGPQFSYHWHDTNDVSPVKAVNLGAQLASGQLLSVVIDGARLASPGLIGQSQRAALLYDCPFIYSLSWHLGPKVQNESIIDGYNQAQEDQLLKSITWPDDGYNLFSISTLAQSSRGGFLGGVPPECSWWVMPRALFLQMGGFDERFVSPGGGLVNHDFRNRVVALPEITPVTLLGEGVFHQFHGGVATNVKMKHHPIDQFRTEFLHIHDTAFRPAEAPDSVLFGFLPTPARRFLGPL